jgi:hypothetical protein
MCLHFVPLKAVHLAGATATSKPTTRQNLLLKPAFCIMESIFIITTITIHRLHLHLHLIMRLKNLWAHSGASQGSS